MQTFDQIVYMNCIFSAFFAMSPGIRLKLGVFRRLCVFFVI